MTYLFFVMAILLVCIAHYVRVKRWELFIQVYEKTDERNLTQALASGYLLNYVLPYKLGDLFRAWYSGKKMKNGKTLGLSTVIVDRYLDVLMVGLIFTFMTFGDSKSTIAKNTVFFYIIVSLILLIITICIFFSRSYLKKILRSISGIFNENIETKILRFCWALIWNFKDIFLKINKRKLILLTVGMWGIYIGSYYCFAEFFTLNGDLVSWKDVFTMLFAQNSIRVGSFGISFLNSEMVMNFPVYMILYMIVPSIVMLIISFIIMPKADYAKNEKEEKYLNLIPQLDPEEKRKFLENYFEDNNKEYVKNYLKINQGISIIRDYSAGSNATTMLCMNNEKTFFRKYAFGQDGNKLYEQIQWIQKHQKELSLPDILQYEKAEEYCFYDMPYSSSTVGLFQYAHSMPIENGWSVMCSALESLEKSIYQNNRRNADKDTIQLYIENKVKKNLKKIKNARMIKPLLQYDKIVINGVSYFNLQYYEKYLQEDYLQKIFANDEYSEIHGDLTIENIICDRGNEKHDFYIIDPNTGNIHDSSNLDYGKMLQSIHGGYEFLMATKSVDVVDNKINFLFTRSMTYIELYQRLQAYMENNFTKERVRSIYFHEIIHWLRLMPYKIEKDGKRALLFYAGMLMVMNDVISMYGDKEDEKLLSNI